MTENKTNYPDITRGTKVLIESLPNITNKELYDLFLGMGERLSLDPKKVHHSVRLGLWSFINKGLRENYQYQG